MNGNEYCKLKEASNCTKGKLGDLKFMCQCDSKDKYWSIEHKK